MQLAERRCFDALSPCFEEQDVLDAGMMCELCCWYWLQRLTGPCPPASYYAFQGTDIAWQCRVCELEITDTYSSIHKAWKAPEENPNSWSEPLHLPGCQVAVCHDAGLHFGCCNNRCTGHALLGVPNSATETLEAVSAASSALWPSYQRMGCRKV